MTIIHIMKTSLQSFHYNDKIEGIAIKEAILVNLKNMK